MNQRYPEQTSNPLPLSIGIYVISLVERTDRRAAIQTQLDTFGVGDRARFVLRKRDPRGGCFGCFESHLHVWREARETHILVFEDDACLNSALENPPTFADLEQMLLEAAEQFTVLFLGAASQAVRPTPTRISSDGRFGLYAGRFTLAHAYFAHRDKLIDELLPRMLPLLAAGCQVDWALMATLTPDRQAAMVPAVFVQTDFADSDNPWVTLPVVGRHMTALSGRMTQSLVGTTRVHPLLGLFNTAYLRGLVGLRALLFRLRGSPSSLSK